jgi:hypothetical protein
MRWRGTVRFAKGAMPDITLPTQGRYNACLSCPFPGACSRVGCASDARSPSSSVIRASFESVWHETHDFIVLARSPGADEWASGLRASRSFLQ